MLISITRLDWEEKRKNKPKDGLESDAGDCLWANFLRNVRNNMKKNLCHQQREGKMTELSEEE